MTILMGSNRSSKDFSVLTESKKPARKTVRLINLADLKHPDFDSSYPETLPHLNISAETCWALTKRISEGIGTHKKRLFFSERLRHSFVNIFFRQEKKKKGK